MLVKEEGSMHTLYCYYTSRRHQCGQGKTHTLDMIVNLQEQQILQLEVKKFYTMYLVLI